MRTANAALDHFVLATPDLEATTKWVTDKTGVVPSAGGQHVGRGTRNMLCSLGLTSYLEIIGPDPEQAAPEHPRPFGIDGLTEPQMRAWAVAVIDIDAAVATARAASFDPGDATAMQRQRPDGELLSWRLTVSESITVPFLIDWDDSRHPATDSAPGLQVAEFQARHPDPQALDAALEALGVTIGILRGSEALLVELRGPLGSIEFA